MKILATRQRTCLLPTAIYCNKQQPIMIISVSSADRMIDHKLTIEKDVKVVVRKMMMMSMSRSY